MGLESVSSLAVYGRVRELLDFIKNILICVSKMNEWGRVINDRIFIFGWTILLSLRKCWLKFFFFYKFFKAIFPSKTKIVA